MADAGITVLVVDDHKIVRDGLNALLHGHGFSVVAEAATGMEALAAYREHGPDIVIMDLHLPDMDGIATTRTILTSDPGARVVFLSAEADPAIVQAALETGARGYIIKNRGFDEVVEALRIVLRGESYLCTAVTHHLLAACQRESRRSDLLSRLSEREATVLQLVAEGKSTKEIAFSLGVSTKTIETQRRSIMQKLGLHTVADLVKCAVREGLTPLD